MAEKTQNFRNHARYVPVYHYVVYPILLLNFGWAAWSLRDVSFPAVLDVLVAARPAPSDLLRAEFRSEGAGPGDPPGDAPPHEGTAARGAGRAGSASSRRCRWWASASPATPELAALARRVLDENITRAKPIKRLITDWQGDHYRV